MACTRIRGIEQEVKLLGPATRLSAVAYCPTTWKPMIE